MSRPASFDELVSARAGAWWRLSWLLTGDSARAQELLELALSRVWRRGAIDTGGGPEAAVRRELVAAHLQTRTHPSDEPPPTQPEPARAPPDVLGPERESLDDLRARVLMALALLAPDQRAAVALRGSPGLSGWDAADALDVSPDRLAALVAEAEAVATGPDRHGGELLGRVADVVPDPPYDAALAARARALAGVHRRRRRVRTAAVVGALAALVAVPVLVSPDPTSAPGEGASAAAREAAAAERLMERPVPDRCAEVPDVPGPPDIPYDPGLSEAVWLRFCPAPDVAGQLDAIAFAPDVTLVAQGVDDLVDGWTTADAGPLVCTRSFPAGQGTVRAQVGTLDGALHVVDLRVGGCGSVIVDGRGVGVNGRAAFADAVRLLGSELLERADDRDLVAAEPLYCPNEIEQLARFTRTTTSTYPQVPGLPVPLPAAGAVVCAYPRPGPGPAWTDLESSFLGPAAAERLRAAYLARRVPAPGCDRARPGVRYGVVLTDATDSRRAFTVDLGGCGTVRGPAGASGLAGPWLTEQLVGRAPTGFGTRLTQ